jgi:hypothetical protein
MVYDLILDDNFDLNIRNGDLLIGESTYQNIQNILVADKGTYKQHPTIGANIKASNLGVLGNIVKSKIRINLEADSLKVSEIKHVDNKLLIKAKYE